MICSLNVTFNIGLFWTIVNIFLPIIKYYFDTFLLLWMIIYCDFEIVFMQIRKGLGVMVSQSDGISNDDAQQDITIAFFGQTSCFLELPKYIDVFYD